MPNQLQIAHTLFAVKHMDSQWISTDSTNLNRMTVKKDVHFSQEPLQGGCRFGLKIKMFSRDALEVIGQPLFDWRHD